MERAAASSETDATTSSSLADLVARRFPPMAYGFAYGSGAFEQPGLYAAGGGARPMLDMIFVAQDAVRWHEQVRLRVCRLGARACCGRAGRRRLARRRRASDGGCALRNSNTLPPHIHT